MQSKKVLIIDDEMKICEILRGVAESCNFEAVYVQTGDRFQSVLSEFNPDVIILDLHLPDMDGIELLRFVSNKHCQSQIILMSGYDKKILSTALQLGEAHGLRMLATLHKPFHIVKIKEMLTKLMPAAEVLTPEILASAIKEDQLELHYQPKVESATFDILSVEALVRWKPPTAPLVFPDAFIPLAERTELIKPLTHWVIKKAFEQAKKWRDENLNLKICINLSSKNLTDLSLPDYIQSQLNLFSLDARGVGFEVTETAAMGQPAIVMDVLTRLRLKDCSLSIDDFGTGYSSFVELHRMPFNEIKIDKSFVINLEHDKESQVISRSIIDLGKNLGLTVVAEGVESRQSMEILHQYGCDSYQGYYFSHPLEADKFNEWLSQYPNKKYVHDY